MATDGLNYVMKYRFNYATKGLPEGYCEAWY